MDWQNLAALILVAAAALYLLWRFWRRGSLIAADGCSACSGCHARQETLHQVELPAQREAQRP